MSDLYPLKFEPVLKEKIWGGKALAGRFNKKQAGPGNIGESWEISGVSDNVSVACNGFLAGNNLEELIEVYMGDLTGDSVYEKFGNEFPLLIKLIEARQDLSIQVHPNDELAKKRHSAYGKTEMWFILESEKDATIYTGFREGVTREIYEEAIRNGTVAELMNVETASPGDVFFTPAGRVHAIGAGIVLAEIQQTSDVTYRIFDWNREGDGREKRELHTDLALGAIDFADTENRKMKVDPALNQVQNLVSCEYFTTDFLRFDKAVRKEYYMRDSFSIYICTEGEFIINWDDKHEHVRKGETILFPAMIKEAILEPSGTASILEVYMNEDPKYI